jgi:hypothetical protein
MNGVNAFWVLGIVSILFSLTALIVGTAALAMVIGLKNSTHQVVWKPLEPPKDEDPFAAILGEEPDEVELEGLHPSLNPNKRKKKEESKPAEEFADLDDPSVSSNNW